MIAYIHAAAVFLWLGLVLAEFVVEFTKHDTPARRYVALIHDRFDNFIEIPLLIAVLTTGGLLLYQAWPAPTVLLIKVACGLIAVAANIACIPLVKMRVRSNDDAEIDRLSKLILLTGAGGPFAIVALYIGVVYFAG